MQEMTSTIKKAQFSRNITDSDVCVWQSQAPSNKLTAITDWGPYCHSL